ncbi:MAG: cytochrome c biogenesis protein/redoxin [Candidatus Pelethousia sp.]|nr:cytochrome c biogenesis protein/redoxin [Candidatus Pelethousia sp.]
MQLQLEAGVPVITVFIQGLLSFFSPCVLPLIPLYIGYLSGGGKSVDENGQEVYERRIVLRNTLFLVLGISFAFGALGLGFTALGRFFSGNRVLFARIGGILVILFGLYQLGAFGSSMTLSQERRLPLRLDKMAMNPWTALILGFVFSFAWTPCVGPILASVLLMAASSASAAKGFFLIGVYTLGFVLPFLAVGLFTSSLSAFFKRHQKALRYTVKVGGLLMVFMGVMMVTGWMDNLAGYLNQAQTDSVTPSETVETSTVPIASPEPASTQTPETTPATSAAKNTTVPAPDFTLVDQNGESHTLSDYKGKVIFLNFWATWCGPCRNEMPDIQALYEDWNENGEEVVILGLAGPNQGREGSIDSIKDFLSENDYTYPVLMDETGETIAAYGISALPTTFMIDKDGNVFGLVRGSVSRESMDSMIKQTMGLDKA